MSNNKNPGWSWFDKISEHTDETQASADIPAIFARCFRGEDGEAALAHLAEMTLARPLGASAHNGILRHLEGQRFLVSYVIGLVRQGRGEK